MTDDDIDDERWNVWRHKLYEAALPDGYATENVPLNEKWIALRVHILTRTSNG